MSSTLLWDAGPGEVRTGLVEQGKLAELRILRLRKGQPVVSPGELFTVRIIRRLERDKALVSLGGGIEAQLQPAPALPEGTLIAVEITRAPIPEPGRWKLPQVRPAHGSVAALAEPGWHDPGGAVARFVRRVAPGARQIFCRDAFAAKALCESLGSQGPEVKIDEAVVEEADIASALDAAVSGEFAFPGGALTIERTRAMTMIDIDGSGDPFALNLAAAREAARLLRLYDIGGPIGMDFVSLPTREQRGKVDAALAEACEALGPHQRTAINGFGFAQIVRSRSGPSIPEMLCGTGLGQLSLTSSALALLGDAARSKGHGIRRLAGTPKVIAVIQQWPDEIEALQSALGTAIELIADPLAIGYGHVHVSQS